MKAYRLFMLAITLCGWWYVGSSIANKTNVPKGGAPSAQGAKPALGSPAGAFGLRNWPLAAGRVETGGAFTNIAVLLEYDPPPVSAAPRFAEVTLAWGASPDAYGLGMVRLVPNDTDAASAEETFAILFTAAGKAGVLAPNRAPGVQELAVERLENSAGGTYTARWQVYSSPKGVTVRDAQNVRDAWAHPLIDFTELAGRAELVLSGKGLALESFSIRLRPQGTLLIVR